MSKTETGLQRAQSYIQRLRAALRPLPEDERASIVSEIESHLAERLLPDGSNAEETLARLGEPETLARAYVEQNELAASISKASPAPLFMSVLARSSRSAMALLGSFLGAIFYLFSMSFLLIAIIKPIAPSHVGLWIGPHDFQFGFAGSPLGVPEQLGLWIVPIAVAGAIGFYLAGTAIIRRCGVWLLSRGARATPI